MGIHPHHFLGTLYIQPPLCTNQEGVLAAGLGKQYNLLNSFPAQEVSVLRNNNIFYNWDLYELCKVLRSLKNKITHHIVLRKLRSSPNECKLAILRDAC